VPCCLNPNRRPCGHPNMPVQNGWPVGQFQRNANFITDAKATAYLFLPAAVNRRVASFESSPGSQILLLLQLVTDGLRSLGRSKGVTLLPEEFEQQAGRESDAMTNGSTVTFFFRKSPDEVFDRVARGRDSDAVPSPDPIPAEQCVVGCFRSSIRLTARLHKLVLVHLD